MKTNGGRSSKSAGLCSGSRVVGRCLTRPTMECLPPGAMETLVPWGQSFKITGPHSCVFIEVEVGVAWRACKRI